MSFTIQPHKVLKCDSILDNKTGVFIIFINLRDGSNPTLKSGQDACADVPAGVSGQHSHPSNVPRQNLPVIKINGN